MKSPAVLVKNGVKMQKSHRILAKLCVKRRKNARNRATTSRAGLLKIREKRANSVVEKNLNKIAKITLQENIYMI